MELSTALKIIHIVAAAILFGVGLGATFLLWYVHRSGNVQAIAVATRSVVLADWLFILPVVFVLPVTGFWMLELTGQDVRQSWLLTALAIYTAAGVCWFPLLWAQIRMRDLAAHAATRAKPLPTSYRRYQHLWFVLSWPVLLAALIIIGLMVARPVLW